MRDSRILVVDDDAEMLEMVADANGLELPGPWCPLDPDMAILMPSALGDSPDRVRGKLQETDPECEWITAVRGQGYALFSSNPTGPI